MNTVQNMGINNIVAYYVCRDKGDYPFFAEFGKGVEGGMRGSDRFDSIHS